MPENRVALVCPLDWGIGHATRCVPVIFKLRELGFEVIVAASGRPLEFLRNEFPGIKTEEFPGTKIAYPENNNFTWKLTTQLPGWLRGIWQEHRTLKRLVERTGATLIISDNRYGCWLSGIPSVFITHQLALQLPRMLRFLEPLLNTVNYRYIHRYQECWIPDFEPHRGLGGALSHPAKLPGNACYIGTLSRFSISPALYPDAGKQPFDLLVMLSGPEPQRTILEKKILKQLVSINMQVAMLRGMPESEEAYVLDNRIHVFAHLSSERLGELINRSSLVICRSGYSSIMDVVSLGKPAIFIPTPGQTEQEYLARYLMEKKIYFSMDQDAFDLLFALEMSKNYPGMVIRNNYRVLEERIKKLCSL
jgi:UDP-N-acetylglucosamine transferase subunit ALG13